MNAEKPTLKEQLICLWEGIKYLFGIDYKE